MGWPGLAWATGARCGDLANRVWRWRGLESSGKADLARQADGGSSLALEEGPLPWVSLGCRGVVWRWRGPRLGKRAARRRSTSLLDRSGLLNDLPYLHWEFESWRHESIAFGWVSAARYLVLSGQLNHPPSLMVGPTRHR